MGDTGSTSCYFFYVRHDLNTCSGNYLNVVVPNLKVECFMNSFKYSGAQVWNEILSHLQCATSVDSLKYKKTLLLIVTNLFYASVL